MKPLKLCFLFALLAACKFSGAQRLDVFGGFNLSGFKHVLNDQRQDATGRFNFHAGLGVFVPIDPKKYKADGDAYGFFPALQLVKRGVSKSTILGPSEADLKMSCLQFNLPLSYVAGSYGIGIGPFGSYAISGKKKYRVGSGNKEKIDFSNELKRFDYGVSIDFKLSILKIQYDLGLANLGKGGNGTVKSRNFSLSLNIPLVDNQ